MLFTLLMCAAYLAWAVALPIALVSLGSAALELAKAWPAIRRALLSMEA